MTRMPKSATKILIPLVQVLTPSCEVVSQKVSEGLDHPLPVLQRMRVRMHLLGCELCSRYERQIKRLHQLMQTSDEPLADATSGLPSATRERIRHNLHKQH